MHSAVSLLDVTQEIQAALSSLRKGQAFITDEIARLEAFLASGTTSPPQAPPKRRGRPPKNAPDGASSAPAKRGPGRPRKNPVTATPADGAPTKRGPGRPRKNAAPGAAPTAAAKRGPGRPRKSPAPDATAKGGSSGKRNWTQAQRDAARKRMQDYWAKRKKS